MQGYLHIEQDKDGIGASQFLSRYFISFPFCGLRWYYTKPTTETPYKLLTDNTIGGWVYGGNIAVTDVHFEERELEVNTSMKYFTIDLNSDGTSKSLLFGSFDENYIHDWIDEIQFYNKSKKYLSICSETNAVPSPTVFFSTLEESLLNGINSTVVDLSNLILEPNILLCIYQMLFRRAETPTVQFPIIVNNNVDGIADTAYSLASHRANMLVRSAEQQLLMEREQILTSLLHDCKIKTTVLLELRLENCQLQDSSMELVNHILLVSTNTAVMKERYSSSDSPNNSPITLQKSIRNSKPTPIIHVSSLRVLSLARNYISAKGIEAIYPGLVKIKETLCELDLSCNYIDDKATLRLLAALSPTVNPNPHHHASVLPDQYFIDSSTTLCNMYTGPLNAAHNHATMSKVAGSGSGGASAPHATHFTSQSSSSASVHVYEGLTKLNLSHNRLTNACSKKLVACLAGYHYKLENLNLSYNAIGNGAAALVALLVRHPLHRLMDANISYCHIHTAAIRDVASAILENMHKAAVDPSSSSSSDKHSVKTTMTPLQQLNVSGNMLDAESLVALMQVVSLQHNFVIHHYMPPPPPPPPPSSSGGVGGAAAGGVGATNASEYVDGTPQYIGDDSDSEEDGFYYGTNGPDGEKHPSLTEEATARRKFNRSGHFRKNKHGRGPSWRGHANRPPRSNRVPDSLIRYQNVLNRRGLKVEFGGLVLDYAGSHTTPGSGGSNNASSMFRALSMATLRSSFVHIQTIPTIFSELVLVRRNLSCTIPSQSSYLSQSLTGRSSGFQDLRISQSTGMGGVGPGGPALSRSETVANFYPNLICMRVVSFPHTITHVYSQNRHHRTTTAAHVPHHSHCQLVLSNIYEFLDYLADFVFQCEREQIQLLSYNNSDSVSTTTTSENEHVSSGFGTATTEEEVSGLDNSKSCGAAVGTSFIMLTLKESVYDQLPTGLNAALQALSLAEDDAASADSSSSSSAVFLDEETEAEVHKYRKLKFQYEQSMDLLLSPRLFQTVVSRTNAALINAHADEREEQRLVRLQEVEEALIQFRQERTPAMDIAEQEADAKVLAAQAAAQKEQVRIQELILRDQIYPQLQNKLQAIYRQFDGLDKRDKHQHNNNNNGDRASNLAVTTVSIMDKLRVACDPKSSLSDAPVWNPLYTALSVVGVQTMYAQTFDKIYPVGANSETENKTETDPEMFHIRANAPFHCIVKPYLRGKTYMGFEYLPSLSPHIPLPSEMSSPPEDEDDEADNHLAGAPDNGNDEFSLPSSSTVVLVQGDENNENLYMSDKRLTGKLVVVSSSLTRRRRSKTLRYKTLHPDGTGDDSSDDEAHNPNNPHEPSRRRQKERELELLEAERQYKLRQYEKEVKRDKRVLTELVLAVRRLHASGSLGQDGLSAKFWEGVLGNPKYEHYMNEILNHSCLYSHHADKVQRMQFNNAVTLFGVSGNGNSICAKANADAMAAIESVGANASSSGAASTSNEYDGVLIGVARRMQLCDAMHKRDVCAMQTFLQGVEYRKAVQGSSSNATYHYAQKLCSSLLSLQRFGEGLEQCATTPADIYKLEEYLLKCAVTGCADEEEVTKVIQQRGSLAKEALLGGLAKHGQPLPSSSFYPEFMAIKQRALLTNVMISRDVPAMRSAIRSLSKQTSAAATGAIGIVGGGDPVQCCISEFSACKRLYNDITMTTTKLRSLVDAATAHIDSLQSLIHEAHKHKHSRHGHTQGHTQGQGQGRVGKLSAGAAAAIAAAAFTSNAAASTSTSATVADNSSTGAGGAFAAPTETAANATHRSLASPPISSFPHPVTGSNVQPVILCLKYMVELLELYTMACFYGIEDGELLKQAQLLIISLSRHPKYITTLVVVAFKEQNIEYLEMGIQYMQYCELTHSVLASAIPRKIFERMAANLREEQIKSRVIKTVLAIRNQFTINDSECFYLLRQCMSLRLDEDPSVSSYIRTLEHYYRKVASKSTKVEEHLVYLLEKQQYTACTEVLSGRGSGRLVMSCASEMLRTEWIHALNKVGRGDYDHVEAECKPYEFNKMPSMQHNALAGIQVIYSGTMEKAARTPNGQSLRSWRSRYFELTNNGVLTYYTKLHGARKGSIRVRGGIGRNFHNKVIVDNADPTAAVPPGEIPADYSILTVDTGGRNFCIELQEGRDISFMDPDFVAEVQSAVKAGRYEELNSKLRQVLRTVKEHPCEVFIHNASPRAEYDADVRNLQAYKSISDLLSLCAELQVDIEPRLHAEAKEVVTRLQKKKVLSLLNAALTVLPRGKIEELVTVARKLSPGGGPGGSNKATMGDRGGGLVGEAAGGALQLTPLSGDQQYGSGASINLISLTDNPLYYRALGVLEKGDVELAILRMRGVLTSYLGSVYSTEAVNPYVHHISKRESETAATAISSAAARLKSSFTLVNNIIDESAFLKHLTRVQRFEPSRLTSRDKKLLVNCLLQKIAIQTWNHVLHGGLLRSMNKALNTTIESVSGYHTETDAFQLCRILMNISDQQRAEAAASNNTVDSDENALLLCDDYSKFLSQRYKLSNYEHLRSVIYAATGATIETEEPPKAKRWSTSSWFKTTHYFGPVNALTQDTVGHHPSDIIVKTLIKGGNKAEESGTIAAYEALLICMNDLVLTNQYLTKKAHSSMGPGLSGDGTSKSTFNTSSNPLHCLVVDLITYGLSNRCVRDELYVHLCKQLRGNRAPRSKMFGWKIMYLYLHYFSAPNKLLPSVYHTMVECLQFEVSIKKTAHEKLASLSKERKIALAARENATEQELFQLDQQHNDYITSFSGAKKTIRECDSTLNMIMCCIKYITHNTVHGITAPFLPNVRKSTGLYSNSSVATTSSQVIVGSQVNLSVSELLVRNIFEDEQIYVTTTTTVDSDNIETVTETSTKQALCPIEIVTLTGSVYRFHAKLATVTSIPSLLTLFYTKCLDVHTDNYLKYVQQRGTIDGVFESRNVTETVHSGEIDLVTGSTVVVASSSVEAAAAAAAAASQKAGGAGTTAMEPPSSLPVDKTLLTDFITNNLLRGFNLYYYRGYTTGVDHDGYSGAGSAHSPNGGHVYYGDNNSLLGSEADADADAEAEHKKDQEDKEEAVENDWHTIPVSALAEAAGSDSGHVNTVDQESRRMQQYIPWNADLSWEMLYSIVSQQSGMMASASNRLTPGAVPCPRPITLVLRKHHVVPFPLSEAYAGPQLANTGTGRKKVNFSTLSSGDLGNTDTAAGSNPARNTSGYSRFNADLQLEIFDRVLPESDPVCSSQHWRHWLRMGEYHVKEQYLRYEHDLCHAYPESDNVLVLPSNHVRVDLLFAEESKTINAIHGAANAYATGKGSDDDSAATNGDGGYINTISKGSWQAWAYLLGIQLALSWGNPLYNDANCTTHSEHIAQTSSPDTTTSHSGVHLSRHQGEVDVLFNSNHSVRPCMQYSTATRRKRKIYEPATTAVLTDAGAEVDALAIEAADNAGTATEDCYYDQDIENQKMLLARESAHIIDGESQRSDAETSSGGSHASPDATDDEEDSEDSDSDSDSSNDADADNDDSSGSSSSSSSEESSAYSESDTDSATDSDVSEDPLCPAVYCTYLPPSFSDLEPHEQTAVEHILHSLGVAAPRLNFKTGLMENPQSIDIQDYALKTASEFHSIAKTSIANLICAEEDISDDVAECMGISLYNPRFRYLCKIAYLTYLSSWELFGIRATDSSSNSMLLTVSTPGHLPEDPHSRSIALSLLSASDYRHMTPEQSAQLAQYMSPPATVSMDREVSICVSLRGLYVFDKANNYDADRGNHNEALFFCHLWDIEEVEVLSKDGDVHANTNTNTRSNSNAASTAGMSRNTSNKMQFNMLMIHVNGCKLQFLTRNADEIKSNIDSAVLDVFSMGLFPNGTAVGSDEESTSSHGCGAGAVAMAAVETGAGVVGEQNPPEFSGRHSQSGYVAMNSSSLYKFFLSEYPLAPVPPTPPGVVRAGDFIPTPKSLREVIATERANEKYRELEQARLARDLQAEKEMRHQESGRKATRTLQEEEEEDDDDEVGNKANRRLRSDSVSSRGSNASGRRRNRSTVTGSATASGVGGGGPKASARSILREMELLNERIGDAVTGVSNRESHLANGFANVASLTAGQHATGPGGSHRRQSTTGVVNLAALTSPTDTMLHTVPKFHQGLVQLDSIVVYERVKVLEPPKLLTAGTGGGGSSSASASAKASASGSGSGRSDSAVNLRVTRADLLASTTNALISTVTAAKLTAVGARGGGRKSISTGSSSSGNSNYVHAAVTLTDTVSRSWPPGVPLTMVPTDSNNTGKGKKKKGADSSDFASGSGRSSITGDVCWSAQTLQYVGINKQAKDGAGAGAAGIGGTDGRTKGDDDEGDGVGGSTDTEQLQDTDHVAPAAAPALAMIDSDSKAGAPSKVGDEGGGGGLNIASGGSTGGVTKRSTVNGGITNSAVIATATAGDSGYVPIGGVYKKFVSRKAAASKLDKTKVKFAAPDVASASVGGSHTGYSGSFISGYSGSASANVEGGLRRDGGVVVTAAATEDRPIKRPKTVTNLLKQESRAQKVAKRAQEKEKEREKEQGVSSRRGRGSNSLMTTAGGGGTATATATTRSSSGVNRKEVPSGGTGTGTGTGLKRTSITLNAKESEQRTFYGAVPVTGTSDGASSTSIHKANTLRMHANTAVDDL